MPDAVRGGQHGIAELKIELKQWEKAFAAANGGRKPGREDIKNDATISAKYKEYDQLRKPPISQTTPRKSTRSTAVKDDSMALTERSANVISTTPRKEHKADPTLQLPALPGLAEDEPTPAHIRCALGPTPQKDGAVLGIFDILRTVTPSKASALPVTEADAIVGATPSKAAPSSSDLPISRTPQSSSKRFYLGAFAGTPIKRKRDDEVYTPSTAKRQYATPSFLRRNFPLAQIDEDSNDTGAMPPPFRNRGVVRSLSSIIQGLKKHEEEKMDDEWDVLNELEAEERGESTRPSVPKVLVEDSQAADMPLGPDQGIETDPDSEPDPGALDANGQPRKVWKKKGLKRQTRRVIMRPVKHKPANATKDTPPDDDGASVVEAVAETQQTDDKAPGDDGYRSLEDDASEAESKHDSQQSSHEPRDVKARKRKQAKRHDGKHGEGPDADALKKPKKVTALAHTNFRKLKIKNKNSKANGRGGRYGRR